MSLDVSLYGELYKSKCDYCGSNYMRSDEVYEGNITHNLIKMADSCGLYLPIWKPKEVGVSKANQLVPYLRDGLKELKLDPQKYKEFNPSNKWGSYDYLLKFCEDYLNACEQYPESTVETWG